MITDKIKEAYSGELLPDDNGFFAKVDRWINIFEGFPPWREVKRAGLGKGGKRKMKALNTAKILCDELAHKCFAEQVDISCGKPEYSDFLAELFDREAFWKNMPSFISKGFAQGGCAVREYIENGKVRLCYVEGQSFYPTAWNNRDITEGIFCSVTARGKFFYTLFEKHSIKDGSSHVECFLYKSNSADVLGNRVPMSEIYGDTPDTIDYSVKSPVFQYWKPDCTNNQQTDLPLGISVFANCTDTLEALDVAFDSFSREFILGKKRIIVPSSCIRTVIDPNTGNPEQYFDADDEVYQALKCDDDKDLKITDNTVELRVEDHVAAINALLNILCFQVGLSPGALSFDRAQGVKTATEVISEENKTAMTIKCNKNLLVEMIEGICRTALALAAQTGEISAVTEDIDLSVSFKDSVIIDDNTLIENNINLVMAGLKSKVSAIMEVLKCDEETAKKELEKIKAENNAVMGSDTAFDPSVSETTEAETDDEEAVEQAEKAAEKTLNGAQTQSLLSVIAQYKQGTLSIGQAVNIISVAIGISKDEARRIIEGAE